MRGSIFPLPRLHSSFNGKTSVNEEAEKWSPPSVLGFWLSDALNRKLKSVDVIKATALKFRLLSIRLTSEVFETDRNMSAIAIYHSWVVARRWGVAGQIITE